LKRIGSTAVLAIVALGAGSAGARPTAPAILCQTYADAAECSGKVANCNACHVSTNPARWNAYGLAVSGALNREIAFEAALPEALHLVETQDADNDGLSNLRELQIGTFPGDASSGWTEPAAPAGAANFRYDVGNFDHRFAFKRLSILYCGHSPSFDEMQAFGAGAPGPNVLSERLHSALDACLNGDHWSRVALPRLADKRIRPLKAAGPDSKVFIGPLRLVIGDYAYDYRMWRYLLTNDRDMRELLTARYHVAEDAEGNLVQVEGLIEKADPGALAGGQPIPPELRAGMITTQWFLTFNTQFSGLPRTTAAQAYRSYLGADLSSNDGIRPVAGEPADIDQKGVSAPECALCHSTLDPLAYAFAKYEGIDALYGGTFGAYRPERVGAFLPGWSDDVQRPVIFGQPVRDLVEWALVAAESDEFKRNMVLIFFEHALNRGPLPNEVEEFRTLWQSLPLDGYSANRLIHRLVDTRAFGVP
jgi:hypothetical protein